ncbi:MAG TPA: hypothetical protein VGM12_14670 [Trebonia sp.]
MHPELISSLAVERRRDVAASFHPQSDPVPAPVPAARALRRAHAPRRIVPSFRVTWTRTTLAAAAGRRRGRSWVIVISATRAL